MPKIDLLYARKKIDIVYLVILLSDFFEPMLLKRSFLPFFMLTTQLVWELDHLEENLVWGVRTK